MAQWLRMPSNTGGAGSFPVWEAKILEAWRLKNQSKREAIL